MKQPKIIFPEPYAKNLTVKVSQTTLDRLKQLAKERSLPLEEVVRTLLIFALDEYTMLERSREAQGRFREREAKGEPVARRGPGKRLPKEAKLKESDRLAFCQYARCPDGGLFPREEMVRHNELVFCSDDCRDHWEAKA